MKEMIKIILEYPSLLAFFTVFIILIYAFVRFVRYWIPLIWRKPKNDIVWVTLIFSVIVLLVVLLEVFRVL